MANGMRTIEIDFEVHRRIEAARRGFEDSPNAVLHRLLGLEEPESGQQQGNGVSKSPGTPWMGKGVSLPEGTELLVDYSEVKARGQVVGGRLKFDGVEYSSPSAAVIGAIKDKRGSAVNVNGWRYMYVKRPGEERWVLVDELRPTPRNSA